MTRSLDEVAFGEAGQVVHLRGYGLIRVFRTDDPTGVAEYWAGSDLGLEPGMRQHDAELSFAIENYHRDLKQSCGVERYQARSERALGACATQPHWVLVASDPAAGMALLHQWSQRVRGELRIIRKAVQGYLEAPKIELPEPSTA